jgi:hypothetical protein
VLLGHIDGTLQAEPVLEVHQTAIVEPRLLLYLVEDLMSWNQTEPLLVQPHVLSQPPILIGLVQVVPRVVKAFLTSPEGACML